jgi:hypothetical protein
MTSSGEGTIGYYEQISIVTFAYVGGTIWWFEGETTIYLLNDEGRAGDQIYIVEHGTWQHGNQGSFRIIGGTGLYEGASDSGAFKFDSPTATYNGVIH